MSPDEATPQDEQLADLLAAFDDALVAGAPPPDGAPLDHFQDACAMIGPRLGEDLECLHLLHQLRPGPSTEDRRSKIEDREEAPIDPRSPEASGERYALIRLHGAGGIGQVWLAHDADLGREVALKELRPERAGNPAIAARFLREARITGRLQHPGIVPVYELVPGSPDSGEGAEPTFYTMRFVKGRTLT